MRDKAQELRAESVIEDERKLEEHTSTAVYIAKEGGYIVIKEPYIHEKVEGLLKSDALGQLKKMKKLQKNFDQYIYSYLCS